jgi:pyruvate decarboxylase
VNGVAGAYSEHVPVVHIVGCPSIKLQKKEALLHHTLGNGDYHVFKDMSAAISHRQVFLDDPVSAPKQIDELLGDAFVHARPVYLMVPTDMVSKKVSGIHPLVDVDCR